MRTTAVGVNPQAVTVAEATQRVFVTDLHCVSVLDAASGQLRRRIDTNTSADSEAVDHRRDHVFVTAANDSVHIFNARTGQLVHVTAT